MYQYGNAREKLKEPGQRFCDYYVWSSKYKIIQRPDKITRMPGGEIWRTYTPTTHIWLQDKNTNKHLWIEFNGNTVIIKSGIRIERLDGFIEANPHMYENLYFFNTMQDAGQFLNK